MSEHGYTYGEIAQIAIHAFCRKVDADICALCGIGDKEASERYQRIIDACNAVFASAEYRDEYGEYRDND